MTKIAQVVGLTLEQRLEHARGEISKLERERETLQETRGRRLIDGDPAELLQIEAATQGLLHALLQSGTPTEAIEFAGTMLKDNVAQQPTVSSEIRVRVEELQKSSKPDDWRKALDLIAESATPITVEQAQARDKLWTPGSESAEPGELWTPGS